MKIIIFFLGCAFSSTAVVLLSYIGVFDIFDSVMGTETEPYLSTPTYLSFISVMMTSVTVVLAVFAITIGLLTVFTIKEIKDKSIERATQIATDVATDQITKVLQKDKIAKIIWDDILNTVPNDEMDDKENNDS